MSVRVSSMGSGAGRRMALSLSALLLVSCSVSTAAEDDRLKQGFVKPPNSAKPRTWWHWTNGNVTTDGITKDLEWMNRVGIGGFQLVDVAAGGGQTVERKINFGTDEWYQAVRHSALEGKRLGLEMSIFSSPGWSEAGGPWVKPEEAMKRLVWSETAVEGGHTVVVKLAQPPANEGPVRDLSVSVVRRSGDTSPAPAPPTFYRDSRVIAFRTPPEATGASHRMKRATCVDGTIDATPLLDDSLNTSARVAAPADGSPAWLQYEYDEPVTVRAFTIGSRGGIPVGRLLASDDGKSFHAVADMPGPQGYHGATVRTFAFPATTARFFRVELRGAPLRPAAVIEGGAPLSAKEFLITEAKLHAEAVVNRWEDKGAFGSLMDVYDTVPTPASLDAAVVQKGTVVDLSSKMAADGTIEWKAPAGAWTVLRVGYALTGARNRPSVPAGSGYEVDKLDAAAVHHYFAGYMNPIKRHLGPLVGDELRFMTMDSWEAGMQNWTADMVAQFTRLRGYDPTPYLPVLTGRVVESAEASDRFLWDFRRTLADLTAANFYGTMEAELKQSGMQSYAEASGVALEIPEDTLANKKEADIPMAEFWVHALHPESMYFVDNRGAASAGHVFGKPIIASEAFTGGGYESPFTLKKIADFWFAQGVNRLVFHTSAHQPLDTKPGNTMVGTHLNRNITWAEQAKPLMAYLSRTQFLLQQGRFVADIACLLPEGAPATMPFWGGGPDPAMPQGYDYDYVNTDVLLRSMSVDADGRLVLPSGMSYRVLTLPPTRYMTLPVLRAIHGLLQRGATVLGSRPSASPTLSSREDDSREWHDLVSAIWGDTDGVTNNVHSVNKGTLYTGLPLAEVLKKLSVPRDFDADALLNHDVAWIHRRDGDADIYFVSNQTDAPENLRGRFRVSGKGAELWHADTGASEPAASTSGGVITEVPLHLAERESVFVIFRGAAATPSRTAPGDNEHLLLSMRGPWKVQFPAKMGAPAIVEMPTLQSWTTSSQAGVKYFSGTATYTQPVTIPAAWIARGSRVLLDLGAVKDLAEVEVNGSPRGVLWKPPYRVDITGALRPGVNQLQIKVTNEWTNRQIGDNLLPEDQRILAPGPPLLRPPAGGRPTTPPPPPPPSSIAAQWKNDGLAPYVPGGNGSGFSSTPRDPLESGLLGPVTLVGVTAH